MYCQCRDPECPECKGECDSFATRTLWRFDWPTEPPLSACAPCAEDMLVSGILVEDDPREVIEDD